MDSNQKILAAAKKARVFAEIDVTSEWISTLEKLGLEESRGRSRVSTKVVWRVAASIVLLISLGLVLNHYAEADKWEQVPVSDRVKEYRLPDESLVALNKQSKLFYTTSRTDARNVKLEGQAFFEVRKDVNRPFRIIGSEATVTVLGTSFSVNSSHNQVEVSVYSGSVSLASNSGNKENITLKPSQSAIYDHDTGMITQLEVDPNDLSWRDGTYSYSNKPIIEALTELSAAFNIDLTFDESLNEDCVITSTFKVTSWEDIQVEFEILYGLEFIMQSWDQVLVKGGVGCD